MHKINRSNKADKVVTKETREPLAPDRLPEYRMTHDIEDKIKTSGPQGGASKKLSLVPCFKTNQLKEISTP